MTSPIERVTEDGVVTSDGTTRQMDVLIFGTGFRTNPFLAPMTIEGVSGRSLEVDWAHGARAYFGLTMTGYPNFFMLYGPNTNLGHNSIIFMLECQIAYVMDAIQWLIAGRPEAHRPEARGDGSVQRAAPARPRRHLVGRRPESWYKDAGRITNNWPYSTFEYWRRTARPGPRGLPRRAARRRVDGRRRSRPQRRRVAAPPAARDSQSGHFK